MDQPVWPVQLQSHVTTRKQRPLPIPDPPSHYNY